MSLEKKDLSSHLNVLKEKKPLVHHITNYVVANETANMTLCFGGLPVMAQSKDEVQEMVTIASALVLNIGTLDKEIVETMILAGKTANEKSVPIIFDPVGTGATKLRTDSAKKILDELNISVIRGNCAEVATLAGLDAKISGVESLAGDGLAASKTLSSQKDCVVAVTGVQDIVTFNKNTVLIDNGHPMMATVTGTGCMATTAIACFCGANDDYFSATVSALAYYGIAGEIAAQNTNNKPGSFHTSLYDAVFNLSGSDFKKAKVEFND